MNKKWILTAIISILVLISSIFFFSKLDADETMGMKEMKGMKMPEGSRSNKDMMSGPIQKKGNMKNMKGMKMSESSETNNDMMTMPMKKEGKMKGMKMDGMKMPGMKMKGMKPGSVMINMSKQQLIGVKTELTQKRHLEKIIRTVGKVEYDERLVKEINLKIEGWIKKLYADYTGKYVKKGDPLFTFYSPQLLSAQEEYLLSVKAIIGKSNNQRFYGVDGSAKTKLLLWDLTENQIKQLEKSGKPSRYQSILSPVSGFIISKSVLEGGHIKPGKTLYKIADLSKVWIYADVYEYELPFVKLGQVAMVTLSSQPGNILKGQVSYIFPFMEEKTRSVRVRLEFSNADKKLKPGMFANVHIHAEIGEQLSISEGAVLNSGLQQTVFLVKGNGMFEPKKVKLGNPIGNFYPVIEGLKEGEVVVSSANFLIDSESKLTASMEEMMGLTGMGDWKMESAKMGKMDMDGMDMSGMEEHE